jgi:hypothetical protein
LATKYLLHRDTEESDLMGKVTMISMVHPVNNFKLIKREAFHLLEAIKIIKIQRKMKKKIKNHHPQDVLIILILNLQ